MDKDLADRLLNVAEKHGLMYTDLETVEEAASALRSSGEAVACYGMRRKGTQAIIGMVPAKVHANPPTAEWYVRDYEEVPLYLHPATPASASDWQTVPKEANSSVIACIRTQLGCDDASARMFWSKLLFWATTPPTSTKGG